MFDRVHFSSATPEWSTPQALFDALNEEFHFTLDPCSTHENAKCVKHFTEADDGLAQDWAGDVVFMNPPYGRQLPLWIAKAALAKFGGKPAVCLIPSRTDTRYWHDHIWDRIHHTPQPGVQVRFIKGRLKFGSATDAAPFPSVVVIFN